VSTQTPLADAASRGGRTGTYSAAIAAVVGFLHAFGIAELNGEQVAALLGVGIPTLSFVVPLVEHRFGRAWLRSAPEPAPRRPRRRKRATGPDH
jgi:hypothetical protein